MFKRLSITIFIVIATITVSNSQEKDAQDTTISEIGGPVINAVLPPPDPDPDPTPPDAPPAPSVSTNTCGDKTVTRNGIPPSGVTWYWQTSSTGQSTSSNNITLTFSNSGTYTRYLRAYDYTSQLWSTTSSPGVTFTVNPPPQTPAAISQAEGCEDVTLTRQTPPSGVTWYWQETSSGTSTTHSTEDYVVNESGTYFLRARSAAGCWSANSQSITVEVPTLPLITSNDITNVQECDYVTVYRDAPPAGVEWYWQTDAQGVSTSNSSTKYESGSEGTIYLRPYKISTGCWGDALTISLSFASPAATPTEVPRIIENFGYSEIEIPENVYFQETNASGKNHTYTDDLVKVYTPGTFYIKEISTNGCWSSSALGFSVSSILPKPDLIIDNGGVCSPVAVALSVSDIYDQYEWKLNGVVQGTGNAISIPSTGTQIVQLTVTINNDPYAPHDDASDEAEPRTFILERLFVNGVPRLNQSTISSIRDQGVLLESSITSATKNVIVEYSGGLNNTVQSIAVGSSPSAKDVISTVEYASNGESNKNYLPYVGCDNSGNFRTNALRNGLDYVGSEQYDFYTNNQGDYVTDNSPYATRFVEASPIKRTTYQTGIGEDWSTKYSYNDYFVNDGTEGIANYTVSNGLPANTGMYQSDQLLVSESKSDVLPDAIQVTFTNTDGQSICTLIKDEVGSVLRKVYHVYDDLGQLRFVLPSQIADGTITQSEIDTWAFQYEYYSNGQVSAKKAPGGGWEYFIYDKYDRLVLTQNHWLGKNRQWIFIKYDNADRPVIKGIFTNPDTSDDPVLLQTSLLSNTDAKNEVYNGSGLHKYSNNAFPTNITDNDYLVINYYDDYDAAPHIFNELKIVDGAKFDLLSGYVVEDIALNQLTSSKVKLLKTSSNTWINSTFYFDFEGHMVQSITDNYEGGQTIVSYNYAFNGSLLNKEYAKNYTSGLKDIKIDYTYEYDHVDRLLKSLHQITYDGNVETEKILASYDYNELGQLKEKHLFSDDNGVNYEQDVDFTYNIQGWLKSINDSQLLDGEGDYFGLEMIHDEELIVNNTTLLPTDDTFVWDKTVEADKPRPNNPGLMVKNGNTGYNRHIYFQFDVSELNPIKNAVLQLYCYNRNARSTAGTTLEIYAVDDSWDETTLTWNNQPTQGALIKTIVIGTGVNTYYDFELSDYFKQEQLNDGIVSFVIKQPGELNEQAVFYSSNSSIFKPILDLYIIENTPNFNSQISGIEWSIYKGNNPAKQGAYVYSYDNIQQLEEAEYLSDESGQWMKYTKFKESMSYDQNGNFESLERRNGNGELIDDLTYDYTDSQGKTSHQIDEITDNATSSGGYEENGSFTYDSDGSLINDPGKDIQTVEYNIFQQPSKFVLNDGTTIEYIFDAEGYHYETLVSDGTTTLSKVYSGMVEYLDKDDGNGYEIELIKHEEGRIVQASDGSMEYQYFMTDHLGNVRAAFTTKDHTYAPIVAEFENTTTDESLGFVNVNPVVDPAAVSGTQVTRLNSADPVGPGFQMAVYPGDKINLSVQAYHRGGSNFDNLFASIATSVAGIFGSAANPTEQFIYDKVNNAVTTEGILGTSDPMRPAAYLNYILFNQDFSSYQFGYTQIGAAPLSAVHDLTISNIDITEPGYLYVYVSNESNSTDFVYFDDLTIEYDPGKVIQMANYYPYGMEHSTSWMRADHVENKYGYNDGSEYEVLLQYVKTPYRMYDPSIGRFTSIDQMANVSSSMTPYHYAGNNPVNANDPTGLYASWYPEMEAMMQSGFGTYSLPTGWGNSWMNTQGPGSGYYWSDGSDRSDWTLSGGSDSYRAEKAYAESVIGGYEAGGKFYLGNFDHEIQFRHGIGIWYPHGGKLVRSETKVINGRKYRFDYYEGVWEPIANDQNGGCPTGDCGNNQVQAGYTPPPSSLPGFPDAQPSKRKNHRKRWKLPNGDILEWDGQHGEVERYDPRGKHIGVWDPDGNQIKDPVPGRRVEPFVTPMPQSDPWYIPSPQTVENVLMYGTVAVGVGIIIFDIVTIPSGEGALGVLMIQQAIH